jgi:hypothetical protein
MPDKINAVLDRIEEDRQRQLDLEPDANSLTFLQKVYRNSVLPLSTRMRAAMAALPHAVPKLGVSVNVNDDGTFAARLDAAIQRTNGHAAKVIDQPKVIEHCAAEIAEPIKPRLAGPLRRRA